MQDIIYSSVAIAVILVVLFYVIRHPFIKEGSQYVKNAVAVAIGVMLTILSVHLLPEIYGSGAAGGYSGYIFLFSLIIFYIIGWVSHGHEHHDEHDSHKHVQSNSSSQTIMFLGQSIHSVADGLVIASSFALSPIVGLVTSMAISMHHIPMMSGVIARSESFGTKKFNTLTILTVISSSFMFLGAFLFHYVSLDDVSTSLIAISAASFLYVGAYDLTSYLREYDDKKIIKRVAYLALGVCIGLASHAINTEHGHEHKSEIASIINADNSSIKATDINEKEIIASTSTTLVSYNEYPKDNIEVKKLMQSMFYLFASSSNRVLDEYDNNPYEWYAEYSIATSTDHRAFVYTVYNYTGGAHGSTEIMPYNIDLKSGNKIESLGDLYNEQAYAYIREYSAEYIKKELTVNDAADMIDVKWIKDGVNEVNGDYTAFWFAGEYLVIHYGQYQVAAYAAGMFDVYIPIKDMDKFKIY